MSSTMDFERVEFRAFDGTLLRGNLFRSVQENAAIVVMAQGVILRFRSIADNIADAAQRTLH
jgi:hypothetical protein